MTLQDELASFYKRSGFGDVVGARSLTVPVYTGCMLVPRKNLKEGRTPIVSPNRQRSIRSMLHIELAAVLLLVLNAALAARGIGYAG